ncbi:uncharacterized protein LOC136065058 [Quercus suber]|uniref:uncharacterized protein LOC136065058 n=1 Tax=Quercus suber TaxID=58331 RepID=UPI0032E00EFD
MQTVKTCEICSVVGHPTDICPTLQEEPIEQVNVVGGFPGQQQRKYDPYSSTYNLGWRDHPNLSYGNPKVNQLATQNRPICQQYKQPYPPRQQQGQTSNSGDETISTRGEGQYSKFGKSDGPNDNCNYGKEIEIPVKAASALLKQENEQNIVADKNVPNNDEVPKRKFPPLSNYKPVPPFPQALVESRKYEQSKDLYETFRRYEVNIPLLDAIKQVPRYVKFLKELCTIKRKQKLKGCEKVRVGDVRISALKSYWESVFAVIQRKLLAKCKYLDLLPDRSIAYSKGVVEDVLMKVNDLVFPANFYVLDMENGDQTTPILLGRPFLKASKTKIDVYNGTLTMEFDGEIVKFNIYDAMKYPNDDSPVYSIDVIDSLAQEVFELNGKDAMEVAISKHLEKENEELALSTDLQETIAALNDFMKLQQSGNVPYMTLPISNERPLPSVLQAPIPDLKPLPSHLKYVFLGDEGTLPVIISSKLSAP